MGNLRLFIACILLIIAFIFTFIFHQSLVANLGECRQPEPGTLTRAGRATGFLYDEVSGTEDTKPVCVWFHSADFAQEWVSQYAPVSLYGIWHGFIIAFVILILPEICASFIYLGRSVLNQVLQACLWCAHVCSISAQSIVARVKCLQRIPKHYDTQMVKEDTVSGQEAQETHDDADNNTKPVLPEQCDNAMHEGPVRSDGHVLPEMEQSISTGFVQDYDDDTTYPVVSSSIRDVFGDSVAKSHNIVNATETNDITSRPITPSPLLSPDNSPDHNEDNNEQRVQEFEEIRTESICSEMDATRNIKTSGVGHDHHVSKPTCKMVLVGISSSLPTILETKADVGKPEDGVCFSGFEADIGDMSDKLSTEACAGSETISSSSRINSASLLELLSLIEDHKTIDDSEAACHSMEQTIAQTQETNNDIEWETFNANQYLRNTKRQVGNLDFQVYRSIVSISHPNAHLKNINDVHEDVTLDNVHPGHQPEVFDGLNQCVGDLANEETMRKPSPELNIQTTISVAKLINEFSRTKEALLTDKDDSSKVYPTIYPDVYLENNPPQELSNVPDSDVISTYANHNYDGNIQHATHSGGDIIEDISGSCRREVETITAQPGSVFNSSSPSTEELLQSRYSRGVVQSIRDNWKRHCSTQEQMDDANTANLSTHRPRSIGRVINQRFKSLYEEEDSILV